MSALAMVFSCEPREEQISRNSDLRLTFSADTVLFDTLLSSVGSITRRFRIYNPNKDAIALSSLGLGLGEDSPYSIIVNGVESHDFSEEVIFGKDSLLVLVEVLIDPEDQDLPFLVKDSVVVQYNGNQQDVKLVAWGQDANFFAKEVIECDVVWDASRPYVLYDTVLVDTSCSLTVMPGTRIYLDNGAALWILGSLKIQGTADEKVIIRNTRFDPAYEIAPGQWDGIYFLEGSFDNQIDHAIITNGQLGLRVGNPDDDDDFELSVSNTSIGHMSVSGVLSYTSDIEMVNCEVFNCQSVLVGVFAGGTVSIDHCTFSNRPNFFSRDQASVGFLDNLEFSDGSMLIADLNVSLTNSIIWGDMDEELVVNLSGQAEAELVINNNIIRSANEDYEVLGNVISQEFDFPGFYSPMTFDYQIDSLSPARDMAEASDIEFDILGTPRDEMPDIGAFERKDSIP